MLSTKPTSSLADYTVLRSFFMDGEARAVGAVVQLQGQFAVEMLAAGKVAPITADEPAPQGAEQTAAPLDFGPQTRPRIPRKTARATEA